MCEGGEGGEGRGEVHRLFWMGGVDLSARAQVGGWFGVRYAVEDNCKRAGGWYQCVNMEVTAGESCRNEWKGRNKTGTENMSFRGAEVTDGVPRRRK